ncbi:helix-turn-helix domain-containing protein [Alkalibacterium gilvum]|uniref:helix-turn-helix domain-containing protein n=1 Tax=Alkalibacterium gilvum TaxID=1130080 RepID=UPI003F926860
MAKQLGVTPETVKRWTAKYKGGGVAGLTESKTWERYSPQLKTKAVEYYLKE